MITIGTTRLNRIFFQNTLMSVSCFVKKPEIRKNNGTLKTYTYMS